MLTQAVVRKEFPGYAPARLTKPVTPLNNAWGTKNMTDAASHEELLYRVAADADRAAFAMLFDYYAPRLKAFAKKGGLSDQVAEEIMQESMVAVWRKAKLFNRAKASPGTWIFTIVRNKRIDHLRRENKPALREEDFIHLEQQAPAADKGFEEKQREESLKQKLKSLPEDQLLVIQKAFWEEKSHSEVAEELQLPLGTVKSRIRLALQRLRGMMDTY